MTVAIDKEKCVMCGLCANSCPDVFKIGDDGKAEVINPNPENAECAQGAATNCPPQAISV